jgi:predicted MPP superfamily phosphohydrolase
MKLAWLTDIHLNFVRPDARERFYAEVRQTQCDALLLGGDIAEAPHVAADLRELAREVEKPVYFVLGNHDFYRSSIADVQAQMRALSDPNLTWLTNSGVHDLAGTTALIGDDGWADGRLGNYAQSHVFLNDNVLIREFVGLDKWPRLRLMNDLADAAAARIRTKLEDARTRHKHVVLLTHVPPFREAAWHEGRPSDDEWLPHFSSKAVGDAIVEVMQQHPDVQLTVLCGHTHGSGVARILPNVLVKTGGAVYGKPAVQEVLLLHGENEIDEHD